MGPLHLDACAAQREASTSSSCLQNNQLPPPLPLLSHFAGCVAPFQSAAGTCLQNMLTAVCPSMVKLQICASILLLALISPYEQTLERKEGP